MKEVLYTIPMNDAMNEHDECPFCFIERNIEQDQLDFTLGSGSTYMESDVRDMTDAEGFCRFHFKEMFDYGNTLGNAWILKTHYQKINAQMKAKFSSYQPGKTSMMDRFKKSSELTNPIAAWIAEKEASCFICKRTREMYDRYLDTFFVMYKRDEQFRDKVKNSKGFCLHHYGDLCEVSQTRLSDKDRAEFFEVTTKVMEENFERISEDVAWLVEKFDYRNKDADWKNSRDAIQRGMQKLKGGYPADPPYQQSK